MEDYAGNLGHPIEGVVPCWVIEVVTGTDKEGRPKITPIAFSPHQAKEMARRITAYYG